MSRRRSYGSSYRPAEPLRGRKLWRYGDWGSASEHLGRHWERVSTPILAEALGQERPPQIPQEPLYVPRVLLTIVADAELAAEVHQAGLAHADAMLLGFDPEGRVIAEPVDFKWSLETATERQVSATGLARLLNAGLPILEQTLAGAIANLFELEGQTPSGELISGHIAVPAWTPPPVNGTSSEDPAEELEDLDVEYAVITRDGVFFAPHNQSNLRYLRGEFSQGKDVPLGEDQVWFQDFDGPEFFGVLPGWSTGVKLAEYDKSTAQLATPDGAERYYRLGAGTAGALTRWHTSIFSEAPAKIDVAAELEELRRAQRLPTSTEIANHLERMMNVRSERESALTEWLREIYGWGRFKGDLGRKGVKLADLDTKSGKRRWGAVFGAIQKSVGSKIRAEGAELVAEGMSDMEALEALQHRGDEFYDFALATSKRFIEGELEQRRGPKI